MPCRCKNFGTPAGCQFGERCTFAHGDAELPGAIGAPPGAEKPGGKRSHDAMTAAPHQYSGWLGEAGFQVVSITPAGCTLAVRGDAMGTVIGKGGMHVRHIMMTTGELPVVHAQAHSAPCAPLPPFNST